MAEVCVPFIQDGQIVVLMPGSGGSLEFVNVIKKKKVRRDVIVAETSTLPYGTRLKGPGHVWVLINAVHSSHRRLSFKKDSRGNS